MQVRRGYLVELILAILVAVASVTLAGSSDGGSEAAQVKRQQAADALAKHHLPAAIAALRRLRIPADFRLRRAGCHWYRCYVAPRPTPGVAPALPAMMQSIGADNPKTRQLAAKMGALSAPSESEA